MAQWPLNLSCDKSFADKKINPKTENRKITPKKEMNDSEEKTCNDNTKQPILVVDLVRLILERLSFVDFHRARCVSSTWYIASKSVTGVTNPTTPWIILFPNKHIENNNNVSCKLYDPHENKTYIIRDIGFDMATSRCLASSGSWFLMLDHRTDFHLLNLFTRERIHIPSLESMDERCMKFKRINDSYGSHIRIDKAVLWVDDKSRDYFTFIFWNFGCFVAYHHKNKDDNNSWKVLQPIKHQGCVDMVFNERKLYILNVNQYVTVFDFFGGDSPVECASFRSSYNIYHIKYSTHLAVTLSGEVLIIVGGKVDPSPGEKCDYNVFQMDPKSSELRIINSIGDEALLLDLGITVPAKDRVMRNCIYFSNDQYHRYNGISLCTGCKVNGICVYHIGTNNVVQVFEHLTTPSTILFKDARWC